MDFNNIIEKRTVNNGMHSLVLEISKNEFDKVMTGNIENTALDVVARHLENRGDDGRANNVNLDYENGEGIVRIYADVDYLGNDHTEY